MTLATVFAALGARDLDESGARWGYWAVAGAIGLVWFALDSALYV